MRICDLDGCGRPHVARGYCQGHYRRWSLYSDPGPAHLRPVRRHGCIVNGCDRDHLARGYCAAHYQRVKATGDPGPAEVREGVASYSGAHLQVERLHGPAAGHPCGDCGDRGEEWAYDHRDPDELYHPVFGSPYSLDPAHYRPLCKPCHQVFDEHPFVVGVSVSTES